jgi:CDP-diacylglycerol--glycerol-3-phosphate 3-phosphatidyltransferase
VQMLTTIIMYVACALTIISLVDYIVKNKQVLASQK